MNIFAYGVISNSSSVNHIEPYWKEILRSHNINGIQDVEILNIAEGVPPLRAAIKNFKAVYKHGGEAPHIDILKRGGLNCGCGHGRGIEQVYLDELSVDITDYEEAALEALAYTLGRRELEDGVHIIDGDLKQNGSGFSGSAQIDYRRPHKKYTLKINHDSSPRINLLGGVELPWYLGIELNEVIFTDVAKTPHIREFSSNTPNTGIKLYHMVSERESYSFEEIAKEHAAFLKTKKEYRQMFPFSSVFLENPGINLSGDYFYGIYGSTLLFSDEFENKKDAGRVRSLKKLDLSKITS